MHFRYVILERQVSKQVLYIPNKVRITDDKSLLNAVQYDHVGAEFTNHTRSNSNFIKSDVIVMDIDNDKTDNPNEWLQKRTLKKSLLIITLLWLLAETICCLRVQ